MTVATQTSLGEIKLAGDLAGSTNALAPELTVLAGLVAGAYTLPTLTVNNKGLVTAISNGTTASLVGLIPVATSTVVGGVKAGTNVTIAGDGTLSLPTATTAAKGIASFNTADFTVTAGAVAVNSTLTLPIATAIATGTVKPGSGLTVAGDGTLNVQTATTSVPGLVKVGSGLAIDGTGLLSATAAPAAGSNTVAGIVKPLNTSNITVVSGNLDVGPNIPQLNTANTYTKAQVVALVSPTFAATMTLDFSLGNVFNFTASSAFTLANPTNVVAGGTYIIIVQQDATGGRVMTLGSNFKMGAGGVSTLSTSPNKIDVFTVVAQSPTVLLLTSQIGFN